MYVHFQGNNLLCVLMTSTFPSGSRIHPDLLVFCSNGPAIKTFRFEPGATEQVPRNGSTYNVIYYRQVRLFSI